MNGDLIIAALRKELDARKEWDERPVLHFMYLEGGSRIRIGGEVIPPEIWVEASPPEVLQWAAEELFKSGEMHLLSGVAPKNFCGVLFRHEAWMLMLNGNSTEEEKQAAVDKGKQHIIHRDPQRIEVRSAMAATADGIYGVTVARDPRIEPITVTPETPGEGTVPEALAEIFAALKGGR